MSASKRVSNLKERLDKQERSVEIDRALLITESYKKNEGKPLILRMALALEHILKNLPVVIDSNELIAGRPTRKAKAAQIFPEVQAGWLEGELPKIRTRKIDPFALSQDDEDILRREILPYWKGKTINEKVFDQIPGWVKVLLYENPSHYPAAGTSIIDNFSLLEKGIGTVVPNYEAVLKKGLNGLIDEAEQGIAHLDLTDPESIRKHEYLTAAVISLRALIRFAGRYADEAERQAEEEDDLKRKSELRELGRICRKVPAEKADTFYEAVQSFWFVHLMVRIENSGHSISPGRFDQYMYPYYVLEKKEGREHRALELIECLFIKFSELTLFSSSGTSVCYPGIPQWQNFNLGGKTKDGKDAVNELSYLCLQAMEEVRTVQPDISVRIHPGTPERFLREACKLSALGTGHPKFYNEDLMAFSMAAKGVSLEDARNFSIMGCVEPRVTRKEGIHLTGGFINLPIGIEFVLTNGRWRKTGEQIGIKTGDPREFRDFQEFFDAWKAQMDYLVKALFTIDAFAEQEYVRTIATPFISAITEGTIAKGKSLQEGGAEYNFGPSVNLIGVGDTADSLLAIKKLVFEEKKYSMDQIVAALENDFQDNEILAHVLASDPCKYGNGILEADRIAKEAVQYVNKAICRNKNIFGGKAQAGIIPVTSGIAFGRAVGALPNGRKAGKPLADGVSPVHGAEQGGPTDVLHSVCRLDPVSLTNGILFNYRISPQAVKAENGLSKFAALVRSYCDLGGWHIQFNVVDNETLRDAKVHPDQYPDLMVRVAGYSAYFAQLSEEVQDDIIERYEYVI